MQITRGVTILTHGFDWSVIKGVYAEILGSSGCVKIGNNVFIGMNTTILKVVNIGNNVIIGANSLVNISIPDNCVAAGNPLKVIMTLEQYYEKRKAAQVKEAIELVKEYRRVYGHDPGGEELSEFFWLFADGKDELHKCWKSKMTLVGNEEQSKLVMREHKKVFPDMYEFLKSID